MKVEITIEIEVDEETFNESELRYDIINSFPERTGHDIHHVDISTEDSE